MFRQKKQLAADLSIGCREIGPATLLGLGGPITAKTVTDAQTWILCGRQQLGCRGCRRETTE